MREFLRAQGLLQEENSDITVKFMLVTGSPEVH